ncbi:MAG: hypothetical protein M0036_24385 [Desulfobacteraceae bacterium]|nr:hypothetical protein [Desulfobacteraceae bacterium]
MNVLMTDKSGAEVERAIQKHGVAHYLPKPFSAERLRSILNQLSEKASNRPALPAGR